MGFVRGDRTVRKLLFLFLLAVALAGGGIYLWVVLLNPSTHFQNVTWINSTELKATQIVPTVDTPIKPGQSWIWCATFQMAWDQLRGDVNGEAITLEGADEVAQRLNNSKYDSNNLVEGTYYTKAGLGSDGIADTIRRDMAKLFPRHSVFPIPNDNVAVAYAYLEATLPFTIPYFQDKLDFRDSDEKVTRVQAFGIGKNHRTSGRWPGEQIDVLYAGDTGFAIDLDKFSSPHQIILASMKPQESLAAAWKHFSDTAIEKKNTRRNFQRSDKVMVPKMNWAVNHHYSNIENKRITNGRLAGNWISIAFQSARFGLDERGAKLSSEAVVEVKKSAEGGSLEFNHPYLIAMLKRGAAEPYFLMWFDNAELMQK